MLMMSFLCLYQKTVTSSCKEERRELPKKKEKISNTPPLYNDPFALDPKYYHVSPKGNASAILTSNKVFQLLMPTPMMSFICFY